MDSRLILMREELKRLFPLFTGSFDYSAVGGGSINENGRISFGSTHLFCKINSASKFPQLFQKEKKGMEWIAREKLIQTPAIQACFESGGYQFLLMEWIPSGARTDAFWKLFGSQMAALHYRSNESFGWEEDNYMGSVEQSNQQSSGWVPFFINHRIEPLVKKCTDNKLLQSRHIDRIRNLYQYLPGIFGGPEKPSLLHGDLWSGNFMCNHDSEPVLIDAAVYYGHRSMDLGMTTLFGGFSKTFYESYNYHYTLPANHDEQWEVCNLYPLLIHLYLFGHSYLGSIEKILDRFR